MPRPAGAWALAQIHYSAPFGARWENGIWYKPDGALPGTFDIQDAVNDFYTAWAAVVTGIMTDVALVVGARLYVNNGTYTASADNVDVTPGTLSGGQLPPDDFVVVRSQANIAGRQGKGRILLSGLDTNVSASGRINAGGTAPMAAITAFLTASVSLNGVGFTAQQYDHVSNTLHLPAYWTYNPVLGNKKKRSPVL